MDRRRFRDFDWGLFLVTTLITAIGIVMIYSATRGAESALISSAPLRQLLWAALGFAVMFVVLFISQDTIEALAPFFYAVAIVLLVAVLFVGVGKTGERRWFDLGVMRLQPSELAKFAVIFALARYLSRKRTRLDRPLHVALPLAMVLVPTALVLNEPDLGTSVIYVLVLIPMLYWGGIRPFFLLLLATPVLSMLLAFNWFAWIAFLAALGWMLYVSRLLIVDKIIVFIINVVMGRAGPLLWQSLEEYQRHRVLAFLNPEKYRFSTGYQLIQSKIAVGSGSVFGKGFLQGTQKNFAFLPERHTDFIFSVLAEEFGFVGCLVVLTLYVYLVVRMFRLASQVRNRFAALVIVGIASTLFIQSAINIGVTLGLSPVTGMPLPLLSYGGSSLLVTLASIGLVLGMGIRRMEY
jgi:rod shape determining protein RodA